MSWLSPKDANALRIWLEVTAGVHAGDNIGIPIPGRPLNLLLLVYLALQTGETASYTAVRTYWQLSTKVLTEALRPLKAANLVDSFVGGKDGRARQLRLTDQGRDVVGQILKARFPVAK